MPKDTIARSTVSATPESVHQPTQAALKPLAIRALVDNAALSITPLWPLRTFIACNPLSGYESESFEQAIASGIDLFGAEGLPSRAMGQAALSQGKIAQPQLRRALAHHTRELKASLSLRGITIPTAELLRVYMTTSESSGWFQSPGNGRSTAAEEDWRTRLASALNRSAIKWLAAFLDEGQAAWSMPGRKQGFYPAWKSLIGFDQQFCQHLDAAALKTLKTPQPDKPEQAIAEALQALQIPQDQLESHMARHLAALPGWAGYIKWRSSQLDHGWQQRYPISLIDYVAVRLVMERLLVETAARRHDKPLQPLFQQPDENNQPALADKDVVAFLKIIARHAGLGDTDLAALTATERQDIDALLTAFVQVEGKIWLQAWEESYRSQLLGELSTVLHRDKAGMNRGETRPSAQLVFCIDVRSEPFRRHLESLGAYETFGFAGFFGIPVHFTPFGADEGVASCPVLLQPKHKVTEIPRADHEHQAEQHLKGLSFTKNVKNLLSSLKQNIAAPFALVETLGGVFGVLMAVRTLAPVTLGRWRQQISALLTPNVALQTTIDLSPRHDQHGDDDIFGLSKQEQVFYAEASLRMMGLTENFAPLVVLCGHGGETVNNPYAAGLDCGACGGNHGGPNARVMAAIYNDVEVRRGLAERGIAIPDDTYFVGAEHNTTTDQLSLYTDGAAAGSHGDAIQRLQGDLATVRERTCLERYSKLEGSMADPNLATLGTLQRSQDWAQVRPEWGLARNAAFIVGPRPLTQQLNLDGRCFLHSYDWQGDPEGKALEVILTAPLVVAEWINMQYYFSTVNNVHYGSGSKVTQNVTGKIGVMQGNASDLMAGLPLQSLTRRDGELYHEPLRLMAVVYAPLPRVAEIIARNTILQHLFDNGWVTLTVIDPNKGDMLRYKKGKLWEHCFGDQDEAAFDLDRAVTMTSSHKATRETGGNNTKTLATIL